MVDNNQSVFALAGQAFAGQKLAVAADGYAARTSLRVVIDVADGPLRTRGPVRLRAVAAPMGGTAPAQISRASAGSTVLPAFSIPGSAEPGGPPV